MELVQGITLSDRLKTYGPLSLGQLVQFFECVAEVVHLAHERGVIHRDLKPSNIMVIELGGRLLPKLLDFGIAKVNHEVTFADHRPGDGVPTAQLLPAPRAGVHPTESDPLAQLGKHELTRSGVALASGPYTAPEQWSNAAAVGRAADVYSLGIIIYEALTGRRPYIADSADGYRRLHCEAPVPALGGGFDFSPALDRVLRVALAKDPADRYANVLELAAALRAVLRASGREQLRSSARQWEDRGYEPDLLWSAELLAELAGVTRRALAGELTPLECSFVAASYRHARRRRWVRRSQVALAGVLAVLGVCGFLLYRAALLRRTADQIAIEAEVEQGRQASLHGESSEAVRHLEQAYQRGDHSPGVSFMLARALQPRMSELARFHSDRRQERADVGRVVESAAVHDEPRRHGLPGGVQSGRLADHHCRRRWHRADPERSERALRSASSGLGSRVRTGGATLGSRCRRASCLRSISWEEWRMSGTRKRARRSPSWRAMLRRGLRLRLARMATGS